MAHLSPQSNLEGQLRSNWNERTGPLINNRKIRIIKEIQPYQSLLLKQLVRFFLLFFVQDLHFCKPDIIQCETTASKCCSFLQLTAFAFHYIILKILLTIIQFICAHIPYQELKFTKSRFCLRQLLGGPSFGWLSSLNYVLNGIHIFFERVLQALLTAYIVLCQLPQKIIDSSFI